MTWFERSVKWRGSWLLVAWVTMMAWFIFVDNAPGPRLRVPAVMVPTFILLGWLARCPRCRTLTSGFRSTVSGRCFKCGLPKDQNWPVGTKWNS